MEKNKGAWRYRSLRKLMGNYAAEGNWEQVGYSMEIQKSSEADGGIIVQRGTGSWEQVGYNSKRVNPSLGTHYLQEQKMNRKMCL